MTHRSYFLPYQIAWLRDQHRLKLWSKSRRIGATYCQAYEDVRDAARCDGMDVWFSSADDSAAAEYIRYCRQWTQLFQLAARDLGEVILESEHRMKARVIEFASGKRVHALSSNPKNFRSKGGKLVLDEFAFHEDADRLWAAAAPIITWGYPARILSTHNGQQCRFYRMVAAARSASERSFQDTTDAEEVTSLDGHWSLHETSIKDAILEGLVERVLNKAENEQASSAERQSFLRSCREAAGDEQTFAQEYLCQPGEGHEAWLSWELIRRTESSEAGQAVRYGGGPCYLGFDVARRHDLSVFWVSELVDEVLWAREVIELRCRSFAEQLDTLASLMERYAVERVAIDQTGMGEPLVEAAQRRHGSRRIDGVLFTAARKRELAIDLKRRFEDRSVRIPVKQAIREAHHAVRRQISAAGNVRFEADRSRSAGHADSFWAHALAVHALHRAEKSGLSYAFHAVSSQQNPVKANFSGTSSAEETRFPKHQQGGLW